jgi:SAM-dependent methyltransferase
MKTATSILNAVHEKVVSRRRVRVLSGLLAKMLPENATVLDVGTGDGSIAAMIMERRKDVAIQGVDVLVRPSTRIPVAGFDGCRLPFESEMFDCVMLIDVLHHTTDPRIQVAEAVRVSKHYVIIKDHLLEGAFAGPILKFMDWIGNRGHDVVLTYNYLNRSAWQEIFSDAGLRIDIWIEELGLYPPPAAWLVERGLHFVTRLAKGQSA